MADIGIEAAFGIWLEKEYGPALAEILSQKFKPTLKGRQLLCPACGRSYEPSNCPKDNKPYTVHMEDGNLRLRCDYCGSRPEFRGNCENDGATLNFYLAGKDPSGFGLKHTEFREHIVRLVTVYSTGEKEHGKVYHTPSFYQGICNMSETSASRVLHHLAKDLKQLREERYSRTAIINDEYMYRITDEGMTEIEKFMKTAHNFSLAKPLKEFLNEIFNDFKRNNMLTLTKRTVEDCKLKPGIDSDRYEIMIRDIPPYKMNDAKDYYMKRFPLEVKSE
ncbi:MAG: hypothetical protein KQA33_03100 [Candidatus Aenigmarchaeota archaeon]|nr:hypothetical protein [Candidatus Aenigmarchaeota archaeon]